mmetsp:Transcript_67742/g.147547  ORF Transcript_67742/g.147547 Transcript_67742/m.147547 type:complete len:204 (+) Transcript_67742:1092-1703(+)
MEAIQIGGPELLLAIGTPALHPVVVPTLSRDVGVVLGGDGTELPAEPLATSRPRRCSRVCDNHSLAHNGLHDTACEENDPAKTNDEDDRTGILPRPHVHLAVHFLNLASHCKLVVVFPLLLDHFRRLRRRYEVHDGLEGRRQPGRSLAGGARIEETASRLPSSCPTDGVGRHGHSIETERPDDVHDNDHNRNDARDVLGRLSR